MKKSFKRLLSTFFAVFTIESLSPTYAAGTDLADVMEYIQGLHATELPIMKVDAAVEHFSKSNKSVIRAFALLSVIRPYLTEGDFEILRSKINIYVAPEIIIDFLAELVAALVKPNPNDPNSVMIYSIFAHCTYDEMKNRFEAENR